MNYTSQKYIFQTVVIFSLSTIPIIMATAVRKIENDEVRAIFESLHDNKPPPPGINFKIVPVDSDGLKLSPPSHEYEGKSLLQH